MTLGQHPTRTGTGNLRLVLGTTNRGKIAELVALLAEKWPQALADAGLSGGDWQLEPISPADTPAGRNLGEVDEHGGTVAENAAIKAQAYARACRAWTLADDTALVVEALGGAPGVHTARFAGPQATAAENRARLLAEMAGVPLQRRTARIFFVIWRWPIPRARSARRARGAARDGFGPLRPATRDLATIRCSRLWNIAARSPN